MFHTLQTLVGSAVMGRLTLLVNHVLASEPVASRRLQPHAGRLIQICFEGWPSLLPPLPPTTFRVTPAGLMEWLPQDDANGPANSGPSADLRVEIDASNPALAMAQALVGERPRVTVAGDAVFAGDVNWLFDNLRWDVQDDLAKIVGPAPARELGRLGAAIASGMREAARVLGDVAGRFRGGQAPGQAAPPAEPGRR